MKQTKCVHYMSLSSLPINEFNCPNFCSDYCALQLEHTHAHSRFYIDMKVSANITVRDLLKSPQWDAACGVLNWSSCNRFNPICVCPFAEAFYPSNNKKRRRRSKTYTQINHYASINSLAFIQLHIVVTLNLLTNIWKHDWSKKFGFFSWF